MKKVLLLMICVCATIGAWAADPIFDKNPQQGDGRYYLIEEATGTWNGQGKVVVIHVKNSEGLKMALEELNKTEANGHIPHHLEPYQGYTMLRIDSRDFTVTDNGAGANPHFTITYGDLTNITLSDNDVSALNAANVTAETIDMQDLRAGAQTTGSNAIALSNTSVKYLILPDGWSKEEVTTTVQPLISSTNFEGAISQGTYEGDPSLVTYLNKYGSLRNTLLHSGYDGHSNKKIGENTGDCSKLRHLFAMGKIAAKDICRTGDFDENGHFVPNVEAAEVNTVNMGVGGVIRRSYVDGVDEEGGMSGNYGLITIDLSDAIIKEEYNADLTLSWSGGVASSGANGEGILGSRTTRVMLPTSSAEGNVVTIPADFLNKACAVHEICIPGHYQNIKTRAFGGTNIDYVWTTGSDPLIRYDNGSYIVSGGTTTLQHRTQKDEGEGEYNMNFQYGTYTLPPSLQLIERFAFFVENHVKDVYVLTTTAPECHVDAFNSTMYHANNHYDQNAITDGVINRDAYTNSASDYRWMTVLHYPNETTDPNIQRYTDPTREYSVATGERDGKGNTIYFPNQSEYEQAFWEGTYGYLWYAWDCSRNWYNNELTKTGDLSKYVSTGGFQQVVNGVPGQEVANDLYEKNNYSGKTDRSFYDVTLDEYYNSVLDQPTGLAPYYNSQWPPNSGTYLYPQPVTQIVYEADGVTPKTKQQQKRDNNGELMWDQLDDDATYEGNYVKYSVDNFVEDPEGIYYQPIVPRNHDTNDQPPYYAYNYTTHVYEKQEYGNFMISPNYEVFVEGETNSQGLPKYDASINSQKYTNAYKDAYRLATSADSGPFYTPVMETVNVTEIVNEKDYRGWHQFVLTAYAHNSTEEFEPLKSFISDNDWWTICEPYDLRYNDLVNFFGTNNGIGTPKIPYLSKLMYVIRDVDNQKITLMFSKNLMEYKEVINTSGHVHGTIDDKTPWTQEELADNPVILHAGVPYLIKPHLQVDDDGNISATREFRIFKNDNEELYNRLKAAQTMGGSAQMQIIYKGEYTVPAYVVGGTKNGTKMVGSATEGIESGGSIQIKNRDNSQFTYQNSTVSGKKLSYKGQEVDYEISSDFKYTFVGSLYKSVMPQYSYFLGWDSKKNCAAFWYSAVQDKSGWNWNNETGIICPNFDTMTAIHAATGLNDPARWTITNSQGVSSLSSDDFTATVGNNSAKTYTMDFGATNFFDVEIAIEGITTDINKVNVGTSDFKVYSADGVYLGSSLRGLAKGLYIVNGKKYVVK